MKRLISLLALLPLMLCSCSKENSSPNVDDTAVRFSTEITTRASGTTWDANDQIGVFMLTAGQPLSGTNLADNVKYTTDGTNFTTTTPIYYPQSGNVDFVAYYPWRATPAADPYIYKVDVGVQTTPAAIDLLYSNNAANKSKSTTAVPLVFDYKLSRIVLTITKGEGMETADLSAMGVQLMGMPTKADFALATGTFSNENAVAAITPRTVAAGTTYDAILIPQTGTTGRKMVFTVGSDVYEYSIPDADDFLSGKSYTYTVTVKKTGVEVSKGQIADWTTTTPGDLGEVEQLPIPMVLIPAGTFIMGSPDSDTEAYNDEKPQHWVKLTQDFYMSKCQITNAQYAAFLNAKSIGSNGEGSVTYNKDGSQVTGTHDFIDDHNMGVQWDNVSSKWLPAMDKADFPVVNVNWYGAKAYVDWVGGSLPTEAQWEYACRAGTATIYSYGNTADGDYMWYSANNTPSGTKAVGRKLPNPWGLYDMHGNVYEWCLDQWDGSENYPTAATEVDAVENPLVRAGLYRVLRGGDWSDYAQNCRSAYRYSSNPVIRYNLVGFRVVFVP